MFFSIWDNETKNYMNTGLNSSSEQEAVEDIFEYLFEGVEDANKSFLKDWSFRTKKDYILGHFFEIHQHTEEIAS
jgi:hypothetical protein